MKADDVKRYQRRLIELTYLAAGQDDGVFGQVALDAYNHYRATRGLPPVNTTTLDELESVLFPRPKISFPPQTGLNILLLVLNLLKGKSMSSDVITQLIRIVGYSAGSYFFGDAVAKGDLFQAALGGACAVVAFVWWAIQQRMKSVAKS